MLNFPLTDGVHFWRIEACPDSGPAFFEDDKWFVSAKGYLAKRAFACFASRAEAELFLELNKEEIHHRCGARKGASSFHISVETTRFPVKFDRPISLKGVGKRGRSRTSLYGRSSR